MISIEVHRSGGRLLRRVLHAGSPCLCFGLAQRLLQRPGVQRCACRNGGFVTEIDRSGYRTRRDLSVAIGE